MSNDNSNVDIAETSPSHGTSTVTSTVKSQQQRRQASNFGSSTVSHVQDGERKQEILNDEIGTLAYRNAIEQNKYLFENKVILDVGSGMGILAMHAAMAGAKHVIGVEFSNIAQQSIQIIKDNHLDSFITIIQGKVEDVGDLPHGIEKVDVIISEWMGCCLFYDSMLNSVLYARDKWLKPNTGILFPDKASLYLAGIEDVKFESWDSVYGVKLSSIRKVAISEPLVDVVEEKRLVTNATLLKEVDLYTVRMEDLAFETQFALSCRRSDNIHALVTYFTVEFTKVHKRTTFSTAPDQQRTHWKQTVFYLEKALTVIPDEEINGVFAIAFNQGNMGNLDFKIGISFHGEFCDLEETSNYCLH